MDEVRYRGATATGFPSPARDYHEDPIDLSKELIQDPLATFIVECRGDSMINAFIPPKTWLVVDRSLTPENGSIVLVVLHGEWKVRFLKKNSHKKWLVPANPKYPEIEITPALGLTWWGVVTYIVSNTKNLALCMR